MPGYRPLGDDRNGEAEREARAAEELVRNGDHAGAAVMLEDAVRRCAASSAPMPPWLCGRLATVYRTLQRYDDEVDLIARYRESQVTDEARTRYDARRSKAEALAEKYRARDSGALASIRRIKKPPR